jgi:pteridine reductase
MTLRGKVALVTGAGTRLGRAIALRLGERGMKVAVHYLAHREGALETAARIRELGGEAEPFQADLMDTGASAELVDRAESRFERLDLLVSSAANFERLPFAEVDAAAWDRALNLNARAGFILAQRAAPSLARTRGSIVFITCSSTITPMRNYLPYVVSKAATLQLARVLALELAPEVRVNAVAPGTVLPPDEMTQVARAALQAKIPLGRLGSAEEVARAVEYLAESDFVTGQQIAVDGGRSLAAIEAYGDEAPPRPADAAQPDSCD